MAEFHWHHEICPGHKQFLYHSSLRHDSQWLIRLWKIVGRNEEIQSTHKMHVRRLAPYRWSVSWQITWAFHEMTDKCFEDKSPRRWSQQWQIPCQPAENPVLMFRSGWRYFSTQMKNSTLDPAALPLNNYELSGVAAEKCSLLVWTRQFLTQTHTYLNDAWTVLPPHSWPTLVEICTALSVHLWNNLWALQQLLFFCTLYVCRT